MLKTLHKISSALLVALGVVHTARAHARWKNKRWLAIVLGLTTLYLAAEAMLSGSLALPAEPTPARSVLPMRYA